MSGQFQIPKSIHSDINRIKDPSFLPRIKYGINSSRNPEKDWIPGQARNDKLLKIFVVMYNCQMNIKCQKDCGFKLFLSFGHLDFI